MHTSAPSGSGRSLRYLIEHFPRGAVEATALCPPGPIVDQFRAGGIQVRPIPGVSMFHSAEGIPLRGLRLLELLRTVWHMRHGGVIRRAIAHMRPDVVHLNDRGMLHAARIARRAGVPVVMHARGVADSARRGGAPEHRPRWRGGTLTAVIAIDESVRRSARRIAERGRDLQPVPDPPDLSGREAERRAHRSSSHGSGHVPDRAPGLQGHLGSARGRTSAARPARHPVPGGWRQQPAGLLPSFAGWAVGASVRLCPGRRECGAGMGGAARARGPRSGCWDRWIGWRTCCVESDILAFPSHLNGPGRAVFEAGIHGIPSIVALKDRVEDVVEDGVTGIIVPPRDPRRLADAIVRLADDPALRRRLGSAARARYAAQFEPAAVARQTLEVYRELTSGRSQSQDTREWRRTPS